MLPIHVDTIRIFLHVLAATVWVGGQITLAGLVPGLRALDADAPRAVARRFSAIAWPAFAVLVATGMWNLVAEDLGGASTEYQVTLVAKLAMVGLSGASAAVHSLTRSKPVLAVSGAIAGLAAIATLFFGLLLSS